jgi:hypothetical protein
MAASSTATKAMFRPPTNNWTKNVPVITASMPMSGCACSSTATPANATKASAMPGKCPGFRPSAISQAATTEKHGFRNSLGCTDMPGSAIQRRAPLISMPATKVSAVSASAMANPTMATRRTPRGLSSDTATTISPATARNSTCFRMNMSRETWMRSATAGLAAITST